jgi:dimethylglycine dehydrogenase
MGLAYFADDRRPDRDRDERDGASDEDITCITAAVAQSHDADVLRRACPRA